MHEEMATAQGWMKENWGPEATILPFSFLYDGKEMSAQGSNDMLTNWKCKRTSIRLDEFSTRTTLTYTDPETKLEVRCVAVEYQDFPTVEWTIYFKNNGTADTPILSDIQALGIPLLRDGGGEEFLLHHYYVVTVVTQELTGSGQRVSEVRLCFRHLPVQPERLTVHALGNEREEVVLPKDSPTDLHHLPVTLHVARLPATLFVMGELN